MRENHSGGSEIMHPEDSKDPDEEVKDPFHGEARLRILDIQERRPVGHEIQCISEPSLYLLRARVSNQTTMSRFELSCVDTDPSTSADTYALRPTV